jgi:hypothetical protein
MASPPQTLPHRRSKALRQTPACLPHFACRPVLFDGFRIHASYFIFRPFTLFLPAKGISKDLAWWVLKLSASVSRPIPAPLPLSDIYAFSNASSGFGIAITIRGRWRAWRLIPGWQMLDGSQDIGWAEAIGFELLIRTIPWLGSASGCFRVYGDNKGVVEGWWNFRSRSKPTNPVFRRIHAFLEQFDHSLSIHSAYVPSKANPADPPSRGIYPPIELLLPDQLISTGSLLMPHSPIFQLKSGSSTKAIIPLPSAGALNILSEVMLPTKHSLSPPIVVTPSNSSPSSPLSSQFRSRFSAELPTIISSNATRRYLSNLTPLVSDLRPHCPARDRLRLWKPTFIRSSGSPDLEITDDDLDQAITVINTSRQPTTRETYRASLLVFYVFCDQRAVPEGQRCPADPLLMLTFITSCAGSYSGSTLANYFYAVHAWHTLHGAPWLMHPSEMKAALDGAAILAPPSSKRLKRCPMTVQTIISLASKLDP